jgi:hypothetical protein
MLHQTAHPQAGTMWAWAGADGKRLGGQASEPA